MLHNIIFQDNIYQLTRSIDLISDGLQLDLMQDMFKDKIVNDILFFDFAVQKLFVRIEAQPQLPDYMDSIQCLYFCSLKYLNLIDFILSKRNEAGNLCKGHFEKLEAIKERTEDIIGSIRSKIQNSDSDGETCSVVSKNELAELLNYVNL